MLIKKSNYWIEEGSTNQVLLYVTSARLARKINAILKVYADDAGFEDSEVRFVLDAPKLKSVATTLLGLKNLGFTKLGD